MDGGGIASQANGEIVTVWRRAQTIYRAAGATETEVGAGKDADIAITNRGEYLIWTSPAGVVIETPGEKKPLLLDANGGFGQLVKTRSGTVIASWESPQGINVKVLDGLHEEHTHLDSSMPTPASGN
jgi:hypothetical protein